MWAATATALSTRPLAASPVAAGRSAATEMPCAAPEIAAVTTFVFPSLRACSHTTSHHWMNRTSSPIKITTGGKMAKRTANLKVTRETPVCALLTVQTDTVVHGTSGPRSANQCCVWAKSAQNRERKALTDLRSSSAVIVRKASPVRCGKMPPPHPSPGSICARRSELQHILSAAWPCCCNKNSFTNGWAATERQGIRDCKQARRKEIMNCFYRYALPCSKIPVHSYCCGDLEPLVLLKNMAPNVTYSNTFRETTQASRRWDLFRTFY